MLSISRNRQTAGWERGYVCTTCVIGSLLCTSGLLSIQPSALAANRARSLQIQEQPENPKLRMPSLGPPIESIKAMEGGAGVLICEPVVAGSAKKETATFGAGCGRWLQFEVGGQGELGKTPMWPSLNRARKELKRSDLQLKPSEIPKLDAMLAVTHAATGVLAETAGKLTLTYQMWRLAGMKPAGPPIAIAGSPAQILDHLPDLAMALSRHAGVLTPHVSTSVGASAAEISELGGRPLGGNVEVTDAEASRLSDIARHTPLAALFLLDTLATDSRIELLPLVKSCADRVPTNVMLMTQIAFMKPEELPKYRARLLQLCTNYPHNAALALSASSLGIATNDVELQRRYAERAVQASFDSADSWLSLAEAYSRLGATVRLGRSFNDLSAPEVSFVLGAYNRWLQASMHAAQQDDQNPIAWLNVAYAASYRSDNRLANVALSSALRLDPTSPRAHYWAMEINKPVWANEPERLRDAALAASKAHYASPRESLYIADAISSSGFQEVAQKLIEEVIASQKQVLETRPNDVIALRLLGSAYAKSNRPQESLVAFQRVEELTPSNPRSHMDLGRSLLLTSQPEKALSAYQEAVRLAPGRVDARAQVADLLMTLNRRTEALSAYQEVVRLSPRIALAFEQIASLLVDAGRGREAILAAQTAVNLTSSSGRAHELLGEALLMDRQFDASVTELRTALRIDPNDKRAKQKLDEALGK